MPAACLDLAGGDPVRDLDERAQADHALAPAQRFGVDRYGGVTGVGASEAPGEPPPGGADRGSEHAGHTRAGWTAVDSRAVTVTLRLGDNPADATDYLADSGVGRAVLDTVPAANKPAALEAVVDALAPHTTNNGVHLDAAIWITSGTART